MAAGVRRLDGEHRVVLRPRVTLADPGLAERAAERGAELHEKAHGVCFIANSVNFPVRLEAVWE